MNIALLTGAYKNSGDFLIENRCKRLIKNNINNVVFHRIMRNEMESRINDINQMDAIVFTGGPLYMPNIETNVPISNCLDDIKTPMMIVGGGWYGRGNALNLPYNYKFSEFSIKFLKKIDIEGYGLACRDLYSVKLLRSYGFRNIYMTGCPAWYDLECVSDNNIKSIAEMRKIVVSDPAMPQNQRQIVDLLKYVREKFKEADIFYSIHRGITELHKEACEFAVKNDIHIIDISGSDEGFSIYDDCDLHIGYRVHAHIYNLSIRNRTILIEEDGRGAGVNETLGIPSIIAYNDSVQTLNKYINYAIAKFGYSINNNVIKDLDFLLDLHEKTEWSYYANAFSLMQRYYLNMKKYILQLNS